MGDKGLHQHECVASPGNGYFAKFENLEHGIFSAVDLYTRKYAGKGPEYITRVWAGNPQSSGYWNAVRQCFN